MDSPVFSQPKKKVKHTTVSSPTDINKMRAILKLVDEEEEMELLEYQRRVEQEEAGEQSSDPDEGRNISDAEDLPEYSREALLEDLRFLEMFLDVGKVPAEKICETVS